MQSLAFIDPTADYRVLPRHSACLVCRRRKQKCDATKPVCNECFSAGRECQYEDETYRSRTQLLQDRIRELEAQIRAIEEKQRPSRPPLSTTTSGRSSDLSSHGSTAGLSFGSPPSSSGGSQAPITPPTTISAFDAALPGPGYLLPPTAMPGIFELDPKLLWQNSMTPDPPPEVINQLLDIFMRRHGQCSFELHMGRVMQGLRPNAIQPAIPVLVNAVLLMACYFAEDPKLKIWENKFFEHTRQEIEASISRAHEGTKVGYNSLHHLQAMLMFGLYHYFKGRLLEGHVHTAQATRFAMALGLHQLDSRMFGQEPVKKGWQGFGVERWLPRDPVELGEAINLWWNCCETDMAGSTLNGLPPAISVEDVTTVWPCSLSHFETNQGFPFDNYSVASLLDPELCDVVCDVTHDDLRTIIPKSYILMVYAAKFDAERISNPQGTEEWWTRFEQYDRAVDRFRVTMPPVASSRSLEELSNLMVVHTSIYCAELMLHNALSEFEFALAAQVRHMDDSPGGLSYVRCNEACRAVALAAAIIIDVDMSYMLFFLGIGWVCVAEVLVREIPRLQRSGYMRQAEDKVQQLAIIEKCMDRLTATFPVLSLQLKQLHTMKERLSN